MSFLPRDPGHTYVKRVLRWADFPTTGRARSGTNHPKHPPKQKSKEENSQKAESIKGMSDKVRPSCHKPFMHVFNVRISFS